MRRTLTTSLATMLLAVGVAGCYVHDHDSRGRRWQRHHQRDYDRDDWRHRDGRWRDGDRRWRDDDRQRQGRRDRDDYWRRWR